MPEPLPDNAIPNKHPVQGESDVIEPLSNPASQLGKIQRAKPPDDGVVADSNLSKPNSDGRVRSPAELKTGRVNKPDKKT